jgi:hypothetical protein
MPKEFPWEDGLLERKVESDLKDLLKTIVAFANSVRPGHTAVILIGEREDGDVPGVTNPETIQQTVRRTCERVYPAVVWRSKVYEVNGRYCVRVEIEYSGETPHFGGKAWVRDGTSSVEASSEVFQRLIAIRLDIVRELGQWIKKGITIEGEKEFTGPTTGRKHPRWTGALDATLESVNEFWITFRLANNGKPYSEPLKKLTLSYDHVADRLKVLIAP